MGYGQTIPSGLVEADITASGGNVHYRQAGSGPDVVLLHGSGNGDGRDWFFSAFARLAETHRVTAFDRPGIGQSALIEGADDPRRQAAHLAAAAAALGIERPIVVGHSYGGAVALAWALEAGDALRGLVLLAPVAYVLPPPDAIFKLLARPALGPALAWVVCRFLSGPAMGEPLKKVFSPQEVPAAYLEHARAALLKNPAEVIANAREIMGLSAPVAAMAAQYGQIQMPVVILQGDSDANVPPDSQAARLVHDLPNATLEMKPGMGHMLHHFRQDDLMAAVAGLDQTSAPGKTDK